MAGLLDGVHVIKPGSMYAAPTAGRMLRDFGAGVIKAGSPRRLGVAIENFRPGRMEA